MFIKVIPVLLCIVFHKTYTQFYYEDPSSSKYAGDLCTLPDNIQGVCTPHYYCEDVLQGHGVTPQTCGFRGSEPIVCCPASSKSDALCKKHEAEVDEVDSTFHTEVFGGTAVPITSHPHMAALGYGDINNIQWNCGGSLISDKFVLTAAHCLNSTEGPVKYVRLGTSVLNNSTDTPQDFEVVRRIRHPDYKPPSTYHDIALLELNKQPKYTENVKPSCLHSGPEIDWGYIGLSAIGYGLTSFEGDRADQLQHVNLQNFTEEECSKAYRRDRRRLPEGILYDRQICAGGREEAKDTCQGDSGGPLEGRIRGLGDIIGVTSFGKPCGTLGVPGVYTRVSYYVPWIESIVWPSSGEKWHNDLI